MRRATEAERANPPDIIGWEFRIGGGGGILVARPNGEDPYIVWDEAVDGPSV